MKLKLCLIHRTCSKTPRTRPNQKEMVFRNSETQHRLSKCDLMIIHLLTPQHRNNCLMRRVCATVSRCVPVCVCVCVCLFKSVFGNPWGFWPWHSSVPFSFPYPLRAAAQPPVTQPVWASPCLIFFAAKYLIFRFPSLSCLFCVSPLSRVTSLPAALSESLPQNSD
jgi:hypothetical protein